MKMPDMCPFEKKEKEVFFRLTTFFFRNKIFCPRNNFCSVFYVLYSKKNFGVIQKLFLKNLLNNIRIFFFQKFLDCSEIFFCFTIHKKLNKSCSLDKTFMHMTLCINMHGLRPYNLF